MGAGSTKPQRATVTHRVPRRETYLPEKGSVCTCVELADVHSDCMFASSFSLTSAEGGWRGVGGGGACPLIKSDEWLEIASPTSLPVSTSFYRTPAGGILQSDAPDFTPQACLSPLYHHPPTCFFI